MQFVQGIIKRVTYHNDDNAYSVLRVTITDSSLNQGMFEGYQEEEITVIGYLPKPAKGEEYRFFGEITHHHTYGEQFLATSFEKTGETSLEGLMEYLASDLFPGVGEKSAERIVSTLGKQTISKILDNPDVLDSVPKITNKLKETLTEGLREHKASEQTLIALYGYGISSRMAMRIYTVYKETTLQNLKENPYKLIDDVEGIGFERADEIAIKLGFTKDHPLRIRAMIFYLFRHLTYQTGATYIPKAQFLETTLYQLNKNETTVSIDVVKSELDDLIKTHRLVDKNGILMLKSIERAEEEIVKKLSTLDDQPLKIDLEKASALINEFEQYEGIQYTNKQKQAIIESLKHRIMVLTGGPGTGKTTVIKGLVHVYNQYHDLSVSIEAQSAFIHLVAPTGRAAKRIKESTGYHASTIHRFLGYDYDGSFKHDKHHKVSGNLFIIDEASMIDVFLASQLLQSLPDFANVLLVGDDAQLPSVGPGQVFKDIIESERVPVVTLDVIHRQAVDSHIITLAQSVREGDLPTDHGHQFEDRYLFSEAPENYFNRLGRIIDYLLSLKYDLIDDIQVLIPMYRGSTGIDETNRFLQETYNQMNQVTLTHQHRMFKINDKVLQLVNQIEDGVMNGDQGRIVDIDQTAQTITVEFLDATVLYQYRDLENITHAYAMSIHKSQGSEYKVVIMPVFNQYAIMLKRKLIYTGITRAKERLIVFGQIDRLSYAVSQLEEARMTLLKDRLQKTYTEPEKTAQIKLSEDMPFDTFGETLDGVTPYDFLDEDK